MDLLLDVVGKAVGGRYEDEKPDNDYSYAGYEEEGEEEQILDDWNTNDFASFMDVPISSHTHFSDAYVNRFVDKFGQASSSMFQGCLHFHGLPDGR